MRARKKKRKINRTSTCTCTNVCVRNQLHPLTPILQGSLRYSCLLRRNDSVSCSPLGSLSGSTSKNPITNSAPTIANSPTNRATKNSISFEEPILCVYPIPRFFALAPLQRYQLGEVQLSFLAGMLVVKYKNFRPFTSKALRLIYGCRSISYRSRPGTFRNDTFQVLYHLP